MSIYIILAANILVNQKIFALVAEDHVNFFRTRSTNIRSCKEASHLAMIMFLGFLPNTFHTCIFVTDGEKVTSKNTVQYSLDLTYRFFFFFKSVSN